MIGSRAMGQSEVRPEYPGRAEASAHWSGFSRAQVAAEYGGIVGHGLARDFLDDVEHVVLAGRGIVALHDENILDALVVFGTIERGAIAHTVKLEAFEGLDDFGWVEGAGAFHG